jgi:hypothetical protein
VAAALCSPIGFAPVIAAQPFRLTSDVTEAYTSLLRSALAVEFVIAMCQEPGAHIRTKALTTLASIADSSAVLAPSRSVH